MNWDGFLRESLCKVLYFQADIRARIALVVVALLAIEFFCFTGLMGQKAGSDKSPAKLRSKTLLDEQSAFN